MKTVNINLVDKICTLCKERVKETDLINLEENSNTLLFLDSILIVKSIYENYVTLCVQNENCNLIRNCSLNESIPICLNSQSIKLTVTNITQ